MSESKNTSSTSGGIGITGLLLVAFIVLKLCGVIKWSWLWVLSPLWIPISLGLIFLAIYIVYLVIKRQKAIKKMKNIKEGKRV